MQVRMKKTTAAVVLAFGLSQHGAAAPLFPDVPENHWASDAVAALAAKGLVEGYPDGTFKGDRATSRWETAMIVARLLAKMEQAHTTFATKVELDELRKLTQALREELDALGVRVGTLEEQTSLLDQRVTELERITFYGSVEARTVFQSFNNDGIGDNDSLRNGGGNAGNVGFINYENAVGSNLGASRRPQLHGVLPVVDYKRSKALTNGTGFTSKAVLGLNVVVTPDIDAGVEFSAFTSQGDAVVDAYWGVSAPWLSNVFSGNLGGGAAQPLNHTPFTRMNLDKFWVLHKPSKTRLTVGEIVKTKMHPLIFAGQANLGVYGPRRWAGYGVDISGEFDVSSDSKLSWEAFRTQFGNSNVYAGTTYENYNLGGNLAYVFNDGAGEIKLNLVRTAEEAPSGGPLVLGAFGPGGGTTGINVAYGASRGWTIRQWVNPPGYFAGQFDLFHQQNSGVLVGGALVPGTTDKRPISGWNGTADNSVGFVPGGGGGNLGPQSQDIYGLTGRYTWDLSDEKLSDQVTLSGEWAHSVYKPSRNSSYDSDGDALRVGLEAALLDRSLDLGVEYLSVDPNYAPASWFGNVLGARLLKTGDFTGVWFMHNSGAYPHNRVGFRVRGKWKFDDNRGAVWAKAKFLEQTQTSLYDVRVNPGAIGAGIPNFPVLGFSPGFIDPVFSGYAHPNIYGGFSANSFTNSLAPLENPRGEENGFEIGASYRWGDPNVKLSAGYSHTDLMRKSSLNPGFGGDQNHVDLDIDMLNVEVNWKATKKLDLTGGVDYISFKGHLDPAGLYHSYAVATNSNSFETYNSDQLVPYLGLDYALSDKTDLGLTIRRYDTTDNVNPSVRAGTAFDSFGSSAHPFDWSGWQVGTHFNMKF